MGMRGGGDGFNGLRRREGDKMLPQGGKEKKKLPEALLRRILSS